MKLRLFVLAATFSLLTPLTASAQDVCYSFGNVGEKVCYSGLFPPADTIVVELGGAIRLPATVLKNQTNQTMNFTIEWAGNNVPGSGTLVAQSLAAGESATFNDLSFEIDGLDLGSYKIDIGFGAAGANNYQISTQHTVDLVVVVPAQLKEIIQVPLRYCVVEGTPQAGDHKPGERVDGKKLLEVLRQAGDEIWLKQAGIFFRHAFAPQGIPVIADPDKSQTSLQLGDLTMTGFGLGEWAEAANDCAKAWEDLYPNQKGIVVVNGRRMIPETSTTVGGVAPGAPYELWVPQAGNARTGKRGDALCGNPRNLLVSDITYMLMAATYDPALYKIIPYTSVTFEPAKVIAHELGHTLMLGHGNGLDDNGDGLLPPTAGRRRFDEYCDAKGQQEDINPPYSLMNSGDAKNITPLQREMARAAAKLVPGAVLPDPVADPAGSLVAAPGPCPADCNVPLTIKQTKIEMVDTPGAEFTNFTHNLFAHAQGGTHSYWVYADLDNNSGTGCSVAEPGRPEFLGAELRTLVTVNSTGTDADAAPTVWQCTAGAWAEVQDAGISASAFALSAATDDGPIGNGGIVTIQLPNAVRGQAGSHVRVQAVAEGESKVDMLPASGTGGVMSLIPPDLPSCSVAPMVAKPGQTVSISANRMPASRMADIFLADAKAGSASTAADGTLAIDVVVPATATEGVRPVEVIVQNGAAGASCAMMIKGSAVTPATTATLTAPPNFNGWNNANVVVALNAVDVPGGPGIASVSYSATGAQPIAPATQPGASASMTINVEGQTTVAFYATNNTPVSEAEHNVTVSLDKTLPSIAYAGNQGSYRVVDNVNITCTASDSLSGLLFDTCVDISGPAYQFLLTGNSFSATAMDYASNLAMASTSFTLVVTYQDMCTLTRQFLNNGPGTPGQVQPLGNSLCAQLGTAEAAAARGNANAKRAAMAAYLKQLKATVPGFLTETQFKILSNLAGAL